jgi:adenosylcobyric acid synthase
MWRDHALPEEDGVFDAAPAGRFALPRGPLATPDAPSAAAAAAALVMVIVAYPHISNLDEFATLKRVPGVRVIWAHEARSVAAADVLVLPGSKHVAADLAWLRATGLDAAIAAHVGADKPTLGVCGGLQMLGLDIDDPAGLEGAATGMGLLPYGTEFKSPKRYRRGRYAGILGVAQWRYARWLRDPAWPHPAGRRTSNGSHLDARSRRGLWLAIRSNACTLRAWSL